MTNYLVLSLIAFSSYQIVLIVPATLAYYTFQLLSRFTSSLYLQIFLNKFWPYSQSLFAVQNINIKYHLTEFAFVTDLLKIYRSKSTRTYRWRKGSCQRLATTLGPHHRAWLRPLPHHLASRDPPPSGHSSLKTFHAREEKCYSQIYHLLTREIIFL